MPATHVHPDNGSDPVDPPAEDVAPSVHDYLELALQTASDTEMSTSELMGIFFYYAHSIAESYRQDVMNGGQPDPS